MSETAIERNEGELKAIRSIASSGSDRPVLMINLNRYSVAAGFPEGENYLRYMAVLAKLLPEVGGRILWRTRVHGQPVGEQMVDEILAAWYPSHQAFLDLRAAPGGAENFRLRAICIEDAVIHRCEGAPLPWVADSARP